MKNDEDSMDLLTADDSCCCYCGKSFEKKKKGLQRSSLASNVRFTRFQKSLTEVIEDEFGITLTPSQKSKQFLCPTCSSSLMNLAKSKISRKEALSALKGSASKTTYLSKKLNVRSPFKTPTPRKIKRQRISSPIKVQSLEKDILNNK